MVPFDGPWPELRPREADNLVELAPGESTEHTFDLAAVYALDAGTYRVTAEYLNDIAVGDALVIDGMVSPAVPLEVGS